MLRTIDPRIMAGQGYRLRTFRAVWVVLIVALAHVACSSTASIPGGEVGVRQDTSLQYANAEPTDTALFAVVVAAIADRPDVVVEVDPRPLQPDPAIVVPDGLDLQPHAAALTKRRSEMLRRMGIEEIDFLEPSRCPFLLAAMAQQSRAWRECEHERTKLRAIIGLPRPGGIYLPGTRYDEREVGLDRGWRVVRVIHDHRYGGVEGGVPPSRLIVAYDYVIEPAPDGGWAFVKKEPLFWLE